MYLGCIHIYIYMYVTTLVISPIDDHFSGSCIAVIVASTIIMMEVQIRLCGANFISFGYILRAGISRSHGSFIF